MSTNHELLTSEDPLVEYGYKRVVLTITAVLCALLEIIDLTIVNVGLTDIKGNMGVNLNDVGWVITAYAIGNVIIVPLTSWLSQQFGRRNYFAASIILFTVASFFCGNSTNIWELVFFRLLQGLGGGALLVTSQAILTESYPREKRGMAQAIYGLGIIVGPTLGPPLGGYIIDTFSWPYIFFINLPVGAVATVLTLLYVKSPNYGGKLKFSDIDWLGIVLLIIGVGSLQFVLERGQEMDWFKDGTIVLFTATAFFGFFFFIWRQLTVRTPVVDLRVLQNRKLSQSVIITFITGFGLFGSTFIIPIFTQSSLGWTAFQAGLIMVPSSLMTAVMMPLVAQLMQRGGIAPKYLIATGFFIFFCYSFWAYKIITPDTGEADFFWLLMVRGFGLGFLSVPNNTNALSTLHGKEIAQGTSFLGMVRQLGGSFGIAIISTFISRDTQTHHARLVSHISELNPVAQQRFLGMKANFVQSGFTPDKAADMAYKTLEGMVMQQATLLTYMDVFLFVGIIFLIVVPFALFMKK